MPQIIYHSPPNAFHFRRFLGFTCWNHKNNNFRTCTYDPIHPDEMEKGQGRFFYTPSHSLSSLAHSSSSHKPPPTTIFQIQNTRRQQFQMELQNCLHLHINYKILFCWHLKYRLSYCFCSPYPAGWWDKLGRSPPLASIYPYRQIRRWISFSLCQGLKANQRNKAKILHAIRVPLASIYFISPAITTQ